MSHAYDMPVRPLFPLFLILYCDPYTSLTSESRRGLRGTRVIFAVGFAFSPWSRPCLFTLRLPGPTRYPTFAGVPTFF